MPVFLRLAFIFYWSQGLLGECLSMLAWGLACLSRGLWAQTLGLRVTSTNRFS